MGYLPTVICLLSAPLANLLLAFLLMIACRFIKSEIILQAAFVNLALGGINLLPMSFLDGGRTLETVLACRVGAFRKDRIMLSLDVICLFVLVAVSVIFAFRRVFPVPLYVFFFYTVFSVMTTRKKNC